MIWIILAVVVLIGFVVYRFSRRLMMDIRAGKARQKGLFSKRNWRAIPFQMTGSHGVPMRMAFSEIATKSAYQGNFKVMFERFIDVAMIADDKLDPEEVTHLVETLYDDLSAIKFLGESHTMTREYGMVQAATLYALICTQDKGANIKRRLMEGNNAQAGNDMYLQQKTDREYFEFINEQYPNFCQLVSILERRKTTQIEIVAGYLLTE
jgi:hypothetical protein